jgi:hypothetical protein
MNSHIETRGFDPPSKGVRLWESSRFPLPPTSAPPLRMVRSALRGENGGESSINNSRISGTSCVAATYGWWRGPIRKNIIGHGMSIGRKQFVTRSRFRCPGKPLRLIHQQPREHSAGVFFDPLVQQRANFLAEIGGVTETREFITLQRIARSREEELPRRLRWGTGHVSLLGDQCRKTNRVIINVYSTQSALSVENCAKLFCTDLLPLDCQRTHNEPAGATVLNPSLPVTRACSACAGNYEDPDRTAWTPEENDERQDESAPEGDSEKFPAEK